MKKFTAELIGTFILVFVGTGAVVFGNGTEGIGHLGIALAFGLSIVAAAYSIGAVSGAHLNPAVSIAMFVNKRMNAKELVCYIAAQVIGAIAASAAIFLVDGAENGLGANGFSTVSAAEAFLFELVVSFIFILVIMTVTSASKGNGKIAGLVIGLTLTAMILVGLNVTGLSVNPARSLAPALFVGGEVLSQVWVFLTAPIAGGILAALVAKHLIGTEAE